VSPSAKWNWRVLQAFSVILVLTGVSGFLIPSELSLMSVATPYNVFHLIAGILGAALAFTRRPVGVPLFNLVFGWIDLYQAVAGHLGVFPADVFALRPADHVLHWVIGAFLAGLGATGLLDERRQHRA
jgi:hypothetical protein